MSLHSELKNLFDKQTIRKSRELELVQVDALAVNAAAGALLRLKSSPLKQIALIQAMKPSTSIAVCRWLADPAFWGVVSNVIQH